VPFFVAYCKIEGKMLIAYDRQKAISHSLAIAIEMTRACSKFEQLGALERTSAQPQVKLSL